METLKTAFVVILLLAVLFGVYSVLNKPDAAPPKEVAWMEKSGPDALKLDIGTGSDTQPSPTPDVGPTGSSPNNGESSKPSDDRSSRKPWDSPPGSSSLGADPTKTPSPNDTDRGTAPPNGPRGFSSPPVAVPELAPDANPGNGATTQPGGNGTTRKNFYEWPPAGDLRSRPPQDMAGNGSSTGTSRIADASGGSRDFPPPSNLRSSYSEPADRGSSTTETNPVTPPAGNSPYNAPQVQANPYYGEQGAKADAAAATPNGGSRYAKSSSFERTIQAAQQQINNKQYREALLMLSQTYGEPNLTTAERDKLLDWLDPLAAKVIYSTEHFVDSPYIVQRGDTLFTIATQYAVPFQLLQNINSVRNPEVLIPDTQLKVMRGPFRAEVDLTGKEITLFVQRMYAGRFPISVGNEPTPAPGEYEVRSKELGHAYFGGGQNLPAEDPRNPYGRCWIDLGKEVCIHGSSAVDTGAGSPGCVGLSPQDAGDVFGILSKGSKVLIRR